MIRPLHDRIPRPAPRRTGQDVQRPVHCRCTGTSKMISDDLVRCVPPRAAS